MNNSNLFSLFVVLFWPQINIFKKVKNFLMIGFAVVSAFISRFVIVVIIRLLYSRPRPFEIYEVTQLLEHSKGNSFPSGHATFFFALSMGIYLFNKKLGIIYFVLSSLLVLSRVAAGIHYPLDILFGAFLGVTFVWFIGRFVKAKMEQKAYKISAF